MIYHGFLNGNDPSFHELINGKRQWHLGANSQISAAHGVDLLLHLRIGSQETNDIQ